VEAELDYWTYRKRVEIEMAGCANSIGARLAHQELASRYGAKASEAQAASQVGLVIAQIPADFCVADDFSDPTFGDPIVEAPRGLSQ
jgi:hypothetical protein